LPICCTFSIHTMSTNILTTMPSRLPASIPSNSCYCDTFRRLLSDGVRVHLQANAVRISLTWLIYYNGVIR
jgi:hypothetical protein